ncbi:hypothetical protein K438DRAFT_1832146 [Mycena galopus ATCC 62051]|nr:hypothetical protein K438DRAFT_1832146 [Mycena galopus ATCC 62051]
MQTRQQAKEAAHRGDIPQPSSTLHNAPIWAPSFASSLSELTPTSSFVSDAGTVQSHESLSTIAETDPEDESNEEEYSNPIAAVARAFGVPVVNHRGRSLRTPMQSQSNLYPPEVFETPRKNWKVAPTEADRRMAEILRDSELAKGLAQLTRDGTLLVLPDSSEEPDYDSEGRTGSGLGSAFASSSRVWKRTTAPSDRASKRPSPLKKRLLQGAKTEVIDPDTGTFVRDQK